MTKFCASLKGYFKIHESNTLQIAWERTAMKFFCRIMIDHSHAFSVLFRALSQARKFISDICESTKEI